MSYKHFSVENFQAHIDGFILDGRNLESHQSKTRLHYFEASKMEGCPKSFILVGRTYNIIEIRNELS